MKEKLSAEKGSYGKLSARQPGAEVCWKVMGGGVMGRGCVRCSVAKEMMRRIQLGSLSHISSLPEAAPSRDKASIEHVSYDCLSVHYPNKSSV